MLSDLVRECDDPDELLPEDRLQQLAEIWNAISSDDYSGATHGVAIEAIEREVTEALSKGKSGLGLAESLTSKALLILSGDIDL